MNAARPPAGAYPGSICYGPGINTAAVLLSSYGNVPSERTANLIGMLPGIPPDERIAAQATQAVFVVQFADDDGRGGIYVLREAEHGALGDGHRPDLAGPLISAAEDPPMDLPQVIRAA